MPLLDVKNVRKTFTPRMGAEPVQVLTGVSFSVEDGEFVAIMGESGSGKTTLLSIIATFEKLTGGEILLDGKDLARLPERQSAAFRREKLGFVFQDFNLLDTFSIKDNIFLPLVLAQTPYEEMQARLEPVARRLGITDQLEKLPYEVSGGQKQRAAVARALITSPRIILADEPTGALDSHAADALLRIFEQLAGESTILMVTHSVRAASHAGRVLFLRDGQIFHQLYRAGRTREQMFAEISDTLTVMQSGGGRHE